MSLFHVQNGSLNLDGVESIGYITPETMQGIPVAEVRMLSGTLLHLAGEALVQRLKAATGWSDPGDGPMVEIEEDAPNASETNQG